VLGDRDTSAAFVIPSNAVATRAVLAEVLDPDQILSIQQQVVTRKIVPRY
jgi:hypothetical protein